jgi:hypothetical protein
VVQAAVAQDQFQPQAQQERQTWAAVEVVVLTSTMAAQAVQAL